MGPRLYLPDLAIDQHFNGTNVVVIVHAKASTEVVEHSRNVTFVKRVVVYGLPILLGSVYYLDA